MTIGPRQLQALKLLAKNEKPGREPLTRSELGTRLGITKVSAHLLVVKLEAAGLVQRTPGAWRNVLVTQRGYAYLGL